MGDSGHCLIECLDLVRIYGDGEEIRALDGVNMRVDRGELLSVMGPSGSGKSTLLNMIGALDKPTSGQVLVNGKDLSSIRNPDAFRAQTVGFIFQLHNLLPTMTALENVEVPMMGYQSAGVRRARAKELLGLVEMEDRKDHLPNQLSGGQRQRVAVARALANNPPLVLADEPTGNLDTEAGDQLMRLIRELNQSQQRTFLVVTHDPAVARQTNRVIVLEDGRIARQDVVGSPLEEDLKMWIHSGLGQQILQQDGVDLNALQISERQMETVREMLRATSSSDA